MPDVAGVAAVRAVAARVVAVRSNSVPVSRFVHPRVRRHVPSPTASCTCRACDDDAHPRRPMMGSKTHSNTDRMGRVNRRHPMNRHYDDLRR